MTSGTAAVKTKTDTSDDKVDWIAEIRGLAVMLLAVFAFHSFIAKPFYIPSESMMPNLLVVIVLSLIRAVQIFDEVYVLTGGGPGTSTMYLTQYIYEVGFASLLRNPGLAAAASIMMGLVLVVLTLVQLGLGRRNEQKGARE